MQKVLKTAVFSLCFAAVAYSATVPVQNMSPWSLAAEYYGSAQGHAYLYGTDGASAALHMFRLHYSPIQFVRFSGGIGGSVPYADPEIKGTEFGIAATGGIAGYLPLGFLTVTVGYDGHFFRSSEERKSQLWGERTGPFYDSNDDVYYDTTYYRNEYSGSTEGTIHTPYAGIIFHLGRHVDLEAGAQYRMFTATRSMSFSTSELQGEDVWVRNDPAVKTGFKDKWSEQFRVYGTLTLHERESGAYLSGGASYAPVLPKKEKDLDLDGQMYRLSVWGQLGLVIKTPGKSGRKAPRSEYSDVYLDMVRRQESMADAMNRDVIREMERNVEEGREEDDFGDEE